MKDLPQNNAKKRCLLSANEANTNTKTTKTDTALDAASHITIAPTIPLSVRVVAISPLLLLLLRRRRRRRGGSTATSILHNRRRRRRRRRRRSRRRSRSIARTASRAHVVPHGRQLAAAREVVPVQDVALCEDGSPGRRCGRGAC